MEKAIKFKSIRNIVLHVSDFGGAIINKKYEKEIGKNGGEMDRFHKLR